EAGWTAKDSITSLHHLRARTTRYVTSSSQDVRFNCKVPCLRQFARRYLAAQARNGHKPNVCPNGAAFCGTMLGAACSHAERCPHVKVLVPKIGCPLDSRSP
ncbi:unnamed protein product, partial [Ixodes pacificus]